MIKCTIESRLGGYQLKFEMTRYRYFPCKILFHVLTQN